MRLQTQAGVAEREIGELKMQIKAQQVELAKLQTRAEEAEKKLAVAEWNRRILGDIEGEIRQLKEDKGLLEKALGEAKAKGDAEKDNVKELGEAKQNVRRHSA